MRSRNFFILFYHKKSKTTIGPARCLFLDKYICMGLKLCFCLIFRLVKSNVFV